MDLSITKSERETLKAIYRLTRDKPEAQTGLLAEALGVAPGTVTMTVKRLAERRLVDHRPYHGVEVHDDLVAALGHQPVELLAQAGNGGDVDLPRAGQHGETVAVRDVQAKIHRFGSSGTA